MEDLIEEFLEELIDKNEITANERTDMKLTLLEAMPREMTEETKGRVMSSLKSKMETPSANIFTDKGVNIDAVRTIANESVKEVVKAVEKEEQAKVEAEAKIDAKVSEAIDSIILDADKKEEAENNKTNEENEEITGDNIDDYYEKSLQKASDYYGGDKDLTSERKRELSITRSHADLFLQVYKQKISSGMTPEDAKKASLEFLYEELGEDYDFDDLVKDVESIIKNRFIDGKENGEDLQELLKQTKKECKGLVDVDSIVTGFVQNVAEGMGSSKKINDSVEAVTFINSEEVKSDYLRQAEHVENMRNDQNENSILSVTKILNGLNGVISSLQTELELAKTAGDANKILEITREKNKQIKARNKFEKKTAYQALSINERQVIDKRNYLVSKAAEAFLSGDINPFEIVKKLGKEADKLGILPIEIVKAAEKMVTNPSKIQNEVFKTEKQRIEKMYEIEAYEAALRTAKSKKDSAAITKLEENLEKLNKQLDKISNELSGKKASIGLKKDSTEKENLLNNIDSELTMQAQTKKLTMILKLKQHVSDSQKNNNKTSNEIIISSINGKFNYQEILGNNFMELLERCQTEGVNKSEIDLEKELDKLIRKENQKYIEITTEKSEQYRQEIESSRYTDYTDSKYTYLLHEKTRIDRELRKAREREMILDENSDKDMLMEDQRVRDALIKGGVYRFLKSDSSVLDIWKDFKRQGIHDIDPQDILNEFMRISKKMDMPEEMMNKTIISEMNTVKNDVSIRAWEELANYAENKGETAYVNELRKKISDARESNRNSRNLSNKAKDFSDDKDIQNLLKGDEKTDRATYNQEQEMQESKKPTNAMNISKLLEKNEVRSSDMVEQINELAEAMNDKDKTVVEGR